MSKWVDVDRLLLELSDLIDEFSELDERGLHSERWCGIMDSKGVIVNAPSIEIVRCKECMERDDDWCMYWGNVINADDFCSYGEREDE